MNQPPTESFLNSKQSLIGIKQHFGSGLELLRYFASYMSNRFRKDNAGSLCCLCERNSVSVFAGYCWRALVNPKFAFTKADALMLLAGRLGVTLKHSAVDFVTVHGLCDACARTHAWRRRFSVVVKGVSFFLLLVCLAVTIFSGGAIAFMRHDAEAVREFSIALAFGLVGLFFAIVGHIWERKLMIPGPLEVVGRRPFFLIKVVEGRAAS